MAFEELGHAKAILVVSLHAELKRFETATEQVAVLRAVHGAHDAAELADGLKFLFGANHDAGQKVVVAREVLGDGMEHVVDAGGNWPEVEWRGERRVDQG